jgi:hypothetical protein
MRRGAMTRKRLAVYVLCVSLLVLLVRYVMMRQTRWYCFIDNTTMSSGTTFRDYGFFSAEAPWAELLAGSSYAESYVLDWAGNPWWSGVYRDGALCGRVEIWRQPGEERLFSAFYSNTMFHGEFLSWGDGGLVETMGVYDKGVSVGPWLYWSLERDSLSLVLSNSHGTPIAVRSWQDGVLVEERVIVAGVSEGWGPVPSQRNGELAVGLFRAGQIVDRLTVGQCGGEKFGVGRISATVWRKVWLESGYSPEAYEYSALMALVDEREASSIASHNEAWARLARLVGERGVRVPREDVGSK